VSNTSTTDDGRLARLEARLNYRFHDRALLEQALTHRSHSRRHNERLEFLGDAVLGYVIADVLYREHPHLAEDALTLLRAELVRGDTLGEIAAGLGLGECLRLGAGERKSGGRQRKSILADAMEAVIGAVSLDGGVDAAHALVKTLFAGQLADVDERPVSKDAKTTLQELLQARALALPHYEVVSTSGSEHRRTFTVSCTVPDLALTTTGEGTSRRAAEKSAAEAMIERMTVDD
jgi:ribonuclease-3